MSTLGTLSKDITQKLSALTLGSDAIGRHATVKVPLASSGSTIGEVHRMLDDHAKDFDSINYIYVVSEKGRLKGALSIRDIFTNNDELKVKEVMATDLIKVRPQKDQEKAAHMALAAGIKSVPIVDEDDYFLGAVTSDRIEKILDHESKEDLLKLTGIIGSHDDEIDGTALNSFKNRVPWIVIGLLGGTATATIIGGFQEVLEQNLVLASFIPLIAYVANAVANQTQTIYIRELAIDAKIIFRKYLLRQLGITFLIALTCWVIIVFLTSLFWGSTILGVIIGLAMAAAITTATFLSLLIPQIMKRLNLDPAVASGPFATVIQDFLSVTIYFSIASLLL